jgi:formylmethanofuran dehydrogenase subunit D
MGAIGLNPIRLDRIGLDPIRINAIKLGVPGAASDRPYIDPEVLASLKAVCICYGKSNDDPNRAVVKNLVDPDNPFVISNAAYTEGSGYADKGSPYYGAFVTDGIDDLITSTKSATEMLDGSNEVTVVSMIHQIKTNDDTTRNNWLFTPVSYLENRIVKDKTGKTGIYGYTSTNVTGAQISDITPILGDKNDYTLYSKIEHGDIDYFSVEGFQNEGIWYTSSVAWYWTIIANKVLTTDQINQVIAYFNLDRTLNPDILCNTIKQGITNENHAEFGDKLIDFSGNGRDIQLNNIAWDGDSGIGKYNYPNWKVNVTQGNKYARIVYYDSINGTYSANFKGITDLYKSYGLSIEIRVNRANTVDFHSIKEDGIYTITPPDDTTSMDIRFGGENVYNASCNITITQIPSHAGGLCLDGINDFGNVTGMPIYKDYTVIADYIRISAKENAADAPILSKSKVINNGAFLFNYLDVSSILNSYSFGTNNMLASISDSERKIYYQSKYVNEGKSINSGTGTDYDSMWLGIYRDNTQIFLNGAIYSLMTFPYSMSEFLIERQLKKHKLGTLYPNMVEFRPIVKSNLPYSSISYSVNPGEYISVDSMVTITITLPNTSDKLMEVSCNAISDISISGDNGVYEITGKVGKSPQKINMIISSYLTMLSNSTLISNETLIKNE